MWDTCCLDYIRSISFWEISPLVKSSFFWLESSLFKDDYLIWKKDDEFIRAKKTNKSEAKQIWSKQELMIKQPLEFIQTQFSDG